MINRKILFTLFLLLPLFIHADDNYLFQIGPEAYHLKREREKGTRQHGILYGARGRMDRITPNTWYWGAEAAWATGTLKGHSGGQQKLRSHLTDTMVEARFGYTFKTTTATCASLTPFVGWGYAWEQNNFLRPSPLKLHFLNTYNYCAVGGFGQVYLSPQWTFGIQVTAKFCRDGRVRITRDPEHKKVVLHFEHKVNCRVCLPITYALGCPESSHKICLNPFFEYRHFAHFSGVPFDFLDTRLKVYGADLYYGYSF